MFDHPEDATPARVIDLDPARNRTGDTINANHPVVRDHILAALRYWMVEMHVDGFRFAQGMIAFRRAHPILSKEQFYTDAEIHWFGPQGGVPDGADPKEKQIACLIQEDEPNALFLMFNAGVDAADFGLPPLRPGARWHLALDTSRGTPQELFAAGKEPLWEDPQTYRLSSRSSAILLVRGTNSQGRQTALTEVQ